MTDREKTAPTPTRVDFGYAFGTPHRLTVALPDSSDKTLLDLQAGNLRLAWTYDDLKRFPLCAFVTPQTQWEVRVQPEIDGQPFAQSAWTRLDGRLPVLVNTYADERGTVRLTVAGGATAAVARVELTNTSAAARCFSLRCFVPGCWAGLNPAWCNPTWARDLLQAGWKDRADRIIVMVLGGQDYEVPAMTTVLPNWRLGPGESRVAWVVRPYRAYLADAPVLRRRKWATEFTAAIRVWRKLLARAAQVTIPDSGVQHALEACLADLFVMREPVADGYVACCPGTECYRAPNQYESGIAAVALDQFGFHAESAAGYQVSLDLQEPDGDWSEPKGWAHHMWGGSGFKAWTGMEHYRLTGDRKYLRALYPRLRASSRWQERQRRTTRVLVAGERPLTYGLMPRGMGDAGLKDGDDLYGVFLPHNIWAVYADQLSVEAAQILGKTKDLPELRRIYEIALADLRQALDRGAIREADYRWISAVPGKVTGSRWGAVNAAFPCGLLPPDHELITGTIRKMEERLSPGGLPIHTGWMVDGMWVAITLDNLAEVLLQRDDGDAVARYLYATLNHGTPLYTWCEERGQQPGTTECSGDRQHLWTPVAVVRMIRDCLLFEDSRCLHVGRGLDRDWLAAGPVGVRRGPTHFGPVSFTLRFDPQAQQLTGWVDVKGTHDLERLVVHARLPAGWRLRPGDGVSADGANVTWRTPRGRLTITATAAKQRV